MSSNQDGSALKKKRKVKAKLESLSTQKVDVESAVKSIDELFESAKKRKVTADQESFGTSTKNGKFSNKPDDRGKRKTKKQGKISRNDFEEDDGGMEYFDDDEDDNGRDQKEDESRTYGLIKSRYKPSQIVNPEAPLERIDPESGLPVYKAHLLKVGDGGGTPLCPFDCTCCF